MFILAVSLVRCSLFVLLGVLFCLVISPFVWDLPTEFELAWSATNVMNGQARLNKYD